MPYPNVVILTGILREHVFLLPVEPGSTWEKISNLHPIVHHIRSDSFEAWKPVDALRRNTLGFQDPVPIASVVSIQDLMVALRRVQYTCHDSFRDETMLITFQEIIDTWLPLSCYGNWLLQGSGRKQLVVK